MAEPSNRRILVAVAMVASSLALAVAMAAPGVAAASTRAHHKDRAKSRGAVVKVEKASKYGKVLVDSSGKVLYFLTDTKGKSFACASGCTGLWPPLFTKGKPRAGSGIARKKLGTVKRGSRLQVTYDGHPLYLYAGDSRARQMNGEGIKSFGGTWYALGSTGSAIRPTLASSKKSSSSSSSSSKKSSGGGW
ncbi:MAG: COG4315 family predicted lipoprotein [Acidimicrobiales bacterium]